MTKLYVKEFNGLAATRQSDSVLAFPGDNSQADQVVDYTAAAADSLPFKKGTEWILLAADAGCSILIQPLAGKAVPTVLNWRLPPNTPVPFRIPGDGSYIVSAITNP